MTSSKKKAQNSTKAKTTKTKIAAKSAASRVVSAKAKSAETASVKKSSTVKTVAKTPAKPAAAKAPAKAKASAKTTANAASVKKQGKPEIKASEKGKATTGQAGSKTVKIEKEAAKQTAPKQTSAPKVPEKAKVNAPVAPARVEPVKGAITPPAAPPVAKPPEKIAEPVTKKIETPVSAAPVAKPAAAKPGHRSGFKTNEFIVYPAHGVGQIIAIEEQEVAGFKLELFVINFVKDKMTLKVPMPKVMAGAIRKLAEPESVKKSLDILTGRARIKRTMWSRRAQEYEAKINSGDLASIAEVVRDLFRSEAQPEQSYSERQLYEAALDRMAREIAAVQRLAETEALKLIEGHLLKGPKRGAKADPVEAAADVADDMGEAA